MSELADEIAATASSLGEVHVRALAAAYRNAGQFATAQAARARQAVPAPHHDTVDRLNLAWAAQPNLAGDAIAVALDDTDILKACAEIVGDDLRQRGL